MASSSCSVEEIEMEKMHMPSAREDAKPTEEGSVKVRAEGEASSSRLAVEIEEKVLDATEIIRNEQNESCPSWVVEMQGMLENTNREEEKARWTQRCIYRVPEWMKNETNSKAYRPWLVSLGPFHHGERHLLPMEEHKRRAVLHLVNRSRRPLREFVAAIEGVVDQLQGAYEDLDEIWRAEKGRFVKMMVMDGCFLLELIRTREIHSYHLGGGDDYAPNDPLFSANYRTLWSKLRNDIIVMENQLPLVVLQRLGNVQDGQSPPSASEINAMVLGLLGRERPGRVPLVEEMDSLGLHPLHIYHKSYRGNCPRWEGSTEYLPRTPCAVELSDAGIKFKKRDTTSIHDVDFEKGVLSMPEFDIHDNTEILHLNLMAFEWLHPGTEHYVGFYISFMDKIINSERDVALLRSEGVLVDITGSDKKVVEIFDTLTKLAWSPKRYKLGHVQCKLNAHCRKRLNRWRAIFVKNYLSNPWLFFSLVAAVILLVATLLQTIYTIVQFYKG